MFSKYFYTVILLKQACPYHRDELELDRLYLRRLGGDRLLLRDFERDLRLGDGERDRLPALNEPRNRAGGDLLQAGIGRRLGGGLGRRAGLTSRGLIGSTICAVISCPSICPPSMCFKAVSALSASSYSTYANPLGIKLKRSMGKSTDLT